MSSPIVMEVLPMSATDNFLVYTHPLSTIKTPVHLHSEYELQLMLNGEGLQRTTGTNVEIIRNIELILVGPNLAHGLNRHSADSTVNIITIHFKADLFSGKTESMTAAKNVAALLAKSSQGIIFPLQLAEELSPRFIKLSKLSSKKCKKEIMLIINKLAVAEPRVLSDSPAEDINVKILLIEEYIRNNHFKKITLATVCELFNMSTVTFNRLIKKHTGHTFIGYLNATRVAFAARWLIESDLSISDIAARTGFYNLANFNRIFKSLKGMSPGSYRVKFFGCSYSG